MGRELKQQIVKELIAFEKQGESLSDDYAKAYVIGRLRGAVATYEDYKEILNTFNDKRKQ